MYDTGGSKHAIRIMRWVMYLFGCQSAVKEALEAKTLNEQREIWRNKIRQRSCRASCPAWSYRRRVFSGRPSACLKTSSP